MLAHPQEERPESLDPWNYDDDYEDLLWATFEEDDWEPYADEEKKSDEEFWERLEAEDRYYDGYDVPYESYHDPNEPPVRTNLTRSSADWDF